MKKRAFITGITGQDGSYLTEHLLSLDYEVHGLVRHSSDDSLPKSRIGHLLNDVNLFYGDITDPLSLESAIIRSRPHEIYHLAAQSHVGLSYKNPLYTISTVVNGSLNLFEAIRNYSKGSRVYNACTSEMFGNSIDEDGFQRETTPLKPANPYACAKVCSYNLAANYRNSYGIFISNGLFFNHESPRRGHHFVTSKIVREAVKISKGLALKLPLGTLSTYRDWGHAKDYVRAMHLILQHNTPDDFVCSSQQTRSIEYLCDYVFSRFDLDYQNFVYIDPEFVRPEETQHLKGNSSKLRETLGWAPEYTFESMIDEMIEDQLKKY